MNFSYEILSTIVGTLTNYRVSRYYLQLVTFCFDFVVYD